jgi:hypothetical protein
MNGPRMSVTLPNPSSRLVRAAAAEHAEIVRHRERLTRERERLLDELRLLDDAVAAADDRLRVLAELLGPMSPGVSAAREGSARSDAPVGDDAASNRDAVRGPAIREVAVRVLVSRAEHIEALHYRRWYELVSDAGYAVAGKDPVAVFLTQLSRSPVVRKAAAPGVYEVDRQAPLRLRQRLERLQGELREVAGAKSSPIELADVRVRRHELDLEISRVERALEEALRSLRPVDPRAEPIGASGAG